MNLLEMAQSAVTPRFVDQASALLGEPPDKVRRGLGGALPGVLAGFIDKGATREGAGDVLQTVSRFEDVGATEGDVETLRATATKGEGLLSGIFDGKGAAVEEGITRYSGMKRGSSHALLGMAAPFVAGLIGREARKRNLDADGMRSMLGDSREAVTRAAPAGMLDSFAGTRSSVTTVERPSAYQDVKVTRTATATAPATRTERATYAQRTAQRGRPGASSSGRWILLGILALAVIAVLLLGRGRPSTQPQAVAPAAAQTWNCSDGRAVSVDTVSPDQIRLHVDNQTQLLNRAASGAFEGSGWSFRSQGNTAQLQQGNAAAATCSLQP